MSSNFHVSKLRSIVEWRKHFSVVDMVIRVMALDEETLSYSSVTIADSNGRKRGGKKERENKKGGKAKSYRQRERRGINLYKERREKRPEEKKKKKEKR